MTCSGCWMPRSPGSRVHCHRKVWPVTISVGDYTRVKWPVTRVLERFYRASGVRWHAGQKMYCHRESRVALGLQARWHGGGGNSAFGVLTVSHTINCRTWEPGRGGWPIVPCPGSGGTCLPPGGTCPEPCATATALVPRGLAPFSGRVAPKMGGLARKQFPTQSMVGSGGPHGPTARTVDSVGNCL